MGKIKILNEGDVIPLGGNRSEWVVIRLDINNGAATLQALAERAGKDVPFAVHCMRVLRWSRAMPPGNRAVVTREALEDLAERLDPLVQRVIAGHSIKWDGDNWVGRLKADAQEASREIDMILHRFDWRDMAGGLNCSLDS